MGNFCPKYSLNTFKNFLNTFASFENSFLELYSLETNSRLQRSRLEIKITALIRSYGHYSVFIGMLACLFLKDSLLGKFEAVETLLKENHEKLKTQEETLILHCDNLFNTLLSLHQNTEIKELKIFKENFRQNASVLLMKMELEQSSNMIFLYSGIHSDILEVFETCNYNKDRFTSEVLKKLNLYFKSKILGMRGLSIA